MTKKVTKRSAACISRDMDRLATLLQQDHTALGIPRDVAMDGAYRLDLLSDHVERIAADFDAKTIGQKKKGPLYVEDKSDDMPGEFTQEEFFSVEEEARKRQAPLPKSARQRRRKAQMYTVAPDDYLPGEWTQEESGSVREVVRPGGTSYPISDIRDLNTRMPVTEYEEEYDDEYEDDFDDEYEDEEEYFEIETYPVEMGACGRYASRNRGKASQRPRKRSRVAQRGSRLEGRRRLAGGQTLYALVIGDGYLYGADASRSASSERYWMPEDEDDWVIYELKNVPADVANDLTKQGSYDQMFDDGYTAWDAAKRYVSGVTDAAENIEDSKQIQFLHGVRVRF